MLLGAGRQRRERNPHLLLQEKGSAPVACTDIRWNLPEYLESCGTAVVSWLLLTLSRLMQLNWGTLASRDEDLLGRYKCVFYTEFNGITVVSWRFLIFISLYCKLCFSGSLKEFQLAAAGGKANQCNSLVGTNRGEISSAFCGEWEFLGASGVSLG